MKNTIVYKDLGLIDYEEAYDIQEKIFNLKIQEKINDKETNKKYPDYILFCEHTDVFTLGQNGSERNLLVSNQELQNKKIKFAKTNRGGDITYHGPGQIVGYPVLDLEKYVKGIKQYIFLLEQSIINCLNLYNIKGERLQGTTGVWINNGDISMSRKICAIGVRTSHWISMHGFALNVNTNLNYFNMINPCGFTDKAVTSLEKELGTKQSIEDVKIKLLKCISECFDTKIIL